MIHKCLVGRYLLMLLAVSFLCIGQAEAQKKFTISGYIRDSDSGEELIGATVFDKQSKLGTAANVYGFYSITLPADSVTMVWSFVGYKAQTRTWLLDADITINIELSDAIDLKEVTVSAVVSQKEHERTQMSSIRIPMKQVESLPAFMGERDVLKAIQLLPGVSSVGEGNSGLYVRGGGPDQNLILLDGVPVYNASHLFGFFSVFNPDALNSVELIKGGFPARYGGRLSSVLDIRMKEGNNNRFKASGSIGLVSSKLTLEGPIKDKTTFIVSGRRTYIDVLAAPFVALANRIQNRNNDEEVRVSGGYYFYDLNAKINHKFNDKSRLFLSSYLGNDRFYANTKSEYDIDGERYSEDVDAGLGWGNITTALRWNYLLSKKLFVNTTLTYSRYRFLTDNKFESSTQVDGQDPTTEKFGYNYFSGIYDWGGKVSFDYLPGPNHYIRAGVSETYHTFRPGVQTINFNASDDLGIDTTFGQTSVFAHEWSAYIEDDMKIGKRLKINPGFHYSGFKVRDQIYHNYQPRFSAAYLVRDNVSIKAAYSNMAQYLHLLTNATIGLPTDLWVPVTDTIPPMLSDQVAAGFAWTHKDDYEISVEGYYKTMKNVIEYKDGASFFFSSEDWESKVEVGDGWSYGVELFAQRKVGRTTGWLGYTLSWTNRQFANINFGEQFPYRYDRRHDISLAMVHQLNDFAELGLVWVYGTGNAVTLPVATYRSVDTGTGGGFLDQYFGNEIDYVASRNGYRTPSYHRLDLSLNLKKPTKWGERTLSVGLYNAYSQQNPFYLYFTYNEQGERVLKQISLFPVLPFISWSFKFDKKRS